jgi:hypothetical protein
MQPRTFHTSLDIVVPSLNSRSPPSQGYVSTRMGSIETLIFPKPVNTQALTGLSTHSNPKYITSLISSLHHPKKTSPLHYHIVPQDVHLFPGLQFIWSRISMMGLSGFKVVNKV